MEAISCFKSLHHIYHIPYLVFLSLYIFDYLFINFLLYFVTEYNFETICNSIANTDIIFRNDTFLIILQDFCLI